MLTKIVYMAINERDMLNISIRIAQFLNWKMLPAIYLVV